MGFGWMYIGVLFLEGVAFFPDVIGYLLILLGVKNASKHCEFFKNTEKMCYVGIVVSLFKLFYKLMDRMNIGLFGEIGGIVFGALYIAFTIAFYIVLFSAVSKIADFTGLPKLKSTALADMLLVTLFLSVSEILNLLISFSVSAIESYSSLVAGTALLLSLLSTLLSAILVFQCYMRICLEGDEDMEKRKNNIKSPFDFYEKGKKSGKNNKKR